MGELLSDPYDVGAPYPLNYIEHPLPGVRPFGAFLPRLMSARTESPNASREPAQAISKPDATKCRWRRIVLHGLVLSNLFLKYRNFVLKLFKLLGQWLNFRSKVAILNLKFANRILMLRIEQHYLRLVLFFLSRRSGKIANLPEYPITNCLEQARTGCRCKSGTREF